nr:uncharacterized protein LOC113810165 [Penaeus vannamei]
MDMGRGYREFKGHVTASTEGEGIINLDLCLSTPWPCSFPEITKMHTSSVFFVVASIMAAAVLASGSHSEMPQHRQASLNPSIERSYMPEPHPMASFYQHQRLQQSPVKTSRLFSVFETPGLLKVGKKVGEFLLGSLVAVGLLILAGVLFSAFSGANFLLPLGLGARSLEDFQYAYEIAQQVYSAIENYAF